MISYALYMLNSWSVAIWDQFQMDFREISDEFHTKCQQVFVRLNESQLWYLGIHMQIACENIVFLIQTSFRIVSDEFQINPGSDLTSESICTLYANTWSAATSDQFQMDFRRVSDKFQTIFRQF